MTEPNLVDATGAADSSSAIEAPEVAATPSSFIDPETIYSKLPDAFKEGKILDEVLSEYNNRHTQALNEATTKYSGFDAFVGIDTGKIAQALQIFDLIDNPDTARRVYDELGRAYGYEAAQQVVQQAVEQQQQNVDNDDELTDEQKELRDLREKISTLEQGQTQANERYQQELQQQYQVTYENEIDTALETVFQADAGLKTDPQRMQDLMGRVAFIENNDRMAGKTRPLGQLVAEAHAQQKAYNQHLFGILGNQGQGSGSAPVVMSPSGGTPANVQDYSKMNQDQLKDAAVGKLLEAMNS